ncbi:MAG: protein kinase domain-containing protein [Myxococcota bacterium]
MVTEGRRYKVLGAVGRGGFGTVYRAELSGEGGFSKVVALKVLNPDMEEVDEMAVRLRDEARVLGLLRHRAIVQVDGLVRLSGRWTVVMEYVEGADLKQVIAARGPIPATVALSILEEVAGALHVAYTRLGPEGKALQLLHRDIKPSNIQVTAAGETKLLDFGVARADFAGREAETRSLMFGSVGYMSPERLDFVDGPEGDVYALGAVLFEMLGGTAFGKTSSKEQRHEARLAAGLDALRAAPVPEPVISLVAEMMAYEPGARPIARDLERRASRLRAEFAGPSLRDWAEEYVSPMLHERRDLPDELSGCTLVEQGSTGEPRASGEPISVPPRASAPLKRPSGSTDSAARTGSRATTAGTVAAVGGIGLLGLASMAVVAAVVAWNALAPSDAPTEIPTVPTAEPAVGTSANAVSELDKPAPAHEPSAASTESPPPTPKPPATRMAATAPAKSASAPIAAPTRPDPAPATAPAARVISSGDARTVELVANGKRLPMGEVPPGAYTIEAAFGDGAPVVAGKVQLVAGATVTLLCDARFTRCQVR